MTATARFLADMNTLETLCIWGVATGGAAGSRLRLAIGSKFLRPKPVENMNLQPELQTHRREYSLYVWCHWIIHDQDRVVMTSEGNSDPNGQMVRAIEDLISVPITNVELVVPSFRLKIAFQNQQNLIMFPVQMPVSEWDDYEFNTPDRAYSVKAGAINESSV